MKNIDYYQVVEMTKEEKIAMYMKLTKKELIEMLLLNQEILGQRIKSDFPPRWYTTCVSGTTINSSGVETKNKIMCLDEVKTALAMNKLVHNECKDVPHDIGLRLLDIVKEYSQTEEEYVEPGSGQQCPFGCHKNSPKSLTDECDIDPDKVIHVEPIMISEAGDISLLIKTLKAIGITFAVLATWIICIAAIHYLYTQFINVVK